jgi:hypothetical protein
MGTPLERPSGRPWRAPVLHPAPLSQGGGWKIEYLPWLPGAPPVLSREMPTCQAAASRAVRRPWALRNEPVAILGPDGRSIRGDELRALLDEARPLRATRRQVREPRAAGPREVLSLVA